MSEPSTPSKIWLVTVIVVAVIVYGELYPFDFRVPRNGPGAMSMFLASWNARPGRGDFLANILFYLPFGFFFLLGLRSGTRRTLALLTAVAVGGSLSLSMELTQYYDGGRVTEATDFYANTLGTLLGGLAGIAMGPRFRMPLSGEISSHPIPASLVGAWLLYRLYPYVPTIDLHKYWAALKPVVLTPSLDPYDLFRQTTIWLTLFALIERIAGGRRSSYLAPPFATAVFCAKVMIVDNELRMAELVGACVAFTVWLLALTLSARAANGIAGLALCCYVTALRLEPFEFGSVRGHLNWIPLYGLMHGSQSANTLAFLEKFFLYGSMLYLLDKLTRRPLFVTLFVAALLLSTSWLETWLPGRSAEITDALMALTIALIFFRLLPREHDAIGSTISGSSRPLEGIPTQGTAGAPVRPWRERAATRLREKGKIIGDIEDY